MNKNIVKTGIGIAVTAALTVGGIEYAKMWTRAIEELKAMEAKPTATMTLELTDIPAPTETPIPRPTRSDFRISYTPEVREIEKIGELETEKYSLEFYPEFPDCDWSNGSCSMQDMYYSGEANKVKGVDSDVFLFDETKGKWVSGDKEQEIVWENGVPKYLVVRNKDNPEESYVVMMLIPEEVKVTIPGSSP